MKKASFIDFETTALNPKKGCVTEVAIIQVLYSENDGKLCKVLRQYTSFNEPNNPIPKFITDLTGITDDLVKGQRIDWDKIKEILEDSDIIIAHNANFDKSWAIEHGECDSSAEWTCSVNSIDWKKHGFKKAKLEYLKNEHKIKSPSHRAIDDVRTLIKILKQPSKKDSNKTYFKELLDNKDLKKYIVECAGKSVYPVKTALKKNGFNWNHKNKSWFKKCTSNNINDINMLLERLLDKKDIHIKELK